MCSEEGEANTVAVPVIWINILCDVLRPSGIMVQYNLETAQCNKKGFITKEV